jgi:lysozyme family protein
LPWETGREKDGSLRKDGGLHYKDGGLPTKYGIWKGANPDVDVVNLSLDDAIELYRERYWLCYLLVPKGTYAMLDKMEIGVAVSLFDAGVNCGVNRAWTWFKKAMKEKDPAKALNEMRGAFYAANKKSENYNG